MSHGLYQCPSCGGPSHGPGECRACLSAPAAGLIQWLPANWSSFTAPDANIAAAMNYMRARYGGSWCEPDGCPASVCGGPHVQFTLPGGSVVIAKPGTPAADLAAAIAYGRHLDDEASCFSWVYQRIDLPDHEEAGGVPPDDDPDRRVGASGGAAAPEPAGRRAGVDDDAVGDPGGGAAARRDHRPAPRSPDPAADPTVT
jgi:hypothetical protein